MGMVSEDNCGKDERNGGETRKGGRLWKTLAISRLFGFGRTRLKQKTKRHLIYSPTRGVKERGPQDRESQNRLKRKPELIVSFR